MLAIGSGANAGGLGRPSGFHLSVETSQHLFINLPVEVNVSLLNDEDVVQDNQAIHMINVSISEEDREVRSLIAWRRNSCPATVANLLMVRGPSHPPSPHLPATAPPRNIELPPSLLRLGCLRRIYFWFWSFV